MKHLLSILISAALCVALVGVAAYLWSVASKAPPGPHHAASARDARDRSRIVDSGVWPGWSVPIRPGEPAVESPVAGAASEPDHDAIPGEHVLSFYDAHDQSEFARIAAALGARVTGRLALGHMLRIRTSSETQLKAILERGPTPLDRSANHVVRMPERRLPPSPPEGVDYTPFDEAAARRLGLVGLGPVDGDVVVAVLDSGVVDHWALPPDRLKAIDMLPASDESGVAGHGAAVASIIAGDHRQLVGVAPGASVLSVRVLGEDGTGDSFTVASGIVAAVDAGARVINLSLGTYGDSLALRSAVAYAEERGAVVVAAAGNDGLSVVTYPARYSTVLAVGAVDGSGQLLYFSNTGADVDLTAPGFGVYSAWTNDQVVRFSGTSAAAPFVAGAAARLIVSDDSLTPNAVREALLQTANDVGAPGDDPSYGAGVLDLGRLEQRDEPDVIDMAARLPHVASGAAGADRVRISCFAENRGTAEADVADLRVTVDGQLHESTGFRILPGGVVQQTIDLGPRPTEGMQILVTVQVALRGRPDASPHNDRIAAALTIPALTTP